MKADIIGSELKITRDNGETIRCLLSNIAMIEFLINNEVQFHFKFGPNNSIKCKTSELYVNGVSSTKTDFEIALFNYNIISGLEAVKTISYELTRPSNTTGYTAGDVVSGSTSSFQLLEFTEVAKSAGRGFVLTNARLQVDNAGSGSNILGKRFRLYLYNAAIPADVLFDNIPYTMIYSNSAFRLGFIDFTLPSTPDAAATTVAAQLDGINKVFQLAGTSLFGRLVSLDTYTPASGSKFFVQIHGIQTN